MPLFCVFIRGKRLRNALAVKRRKIEVAYGRRTFDWH